MTTVFMHIATVHFSSVVKFCYSKRNSNGTEAALKEGRKQLRKTLRKNSIRKGAGIAGAGERGMKLHANPWNTEESQPRYCKHTGRRDAKGKT